MKLKKEYKIENDKLYVNFREPLVTKDIGLCPVCEKLYYAAEGQLVTYNKDGYPVHKRCKKKGMKRRLLDFINVV